MPVATVTALYGRRTDRSGAEQWAGGLPGGIFGQSRSDGLTLVVASIPAALHVIGAGHDAVVAPGRPKGFSKADLAALVSERADLIVMGQGTGPLAEELARRGAAVSLAAQDIDLAAMLGSAPDPSAALASLVGDAAPVVTAVAETGDAGPAPIPVIPTPVVATMVPAGGDVDEVYVHAGSRSWRVRGAAARANGEGELLRVALSVTDSVSGRFHLDTLDLYSARQRSGFLAAAVTELRAERDVLATELAEVIGAAERRRDDSATHKAAPVPVMTDAERAEAMDLLTDPDLLDRLGSDLAALGVVGEQTNLLVVLPGHHLPVVRTSLRGPGPVVVGRGQVDAERRRVLVGAERGPGRRSRPSPPRPSTTWAVADLSRKVLAVAEEQGAARASYALKLLVSEGRLSIASTGKDKSTRAPLDRQLRDRRSDRLGHDHDGDRHRPRAGEPTGGARRRRGRHPDPGHRRGPTRVGHPRRAQCPDHPGTPAPPPCQRPAAARSVPGCHLATWTPSSRPRPPGTGATTPSCSRSSRRVTAAAPAPAGAQDARCGRHHDHLPRSHRGRRGQRHGPGPPGAGARHRQPLTPGGTTAPSRARGPVPGQKAAETRV